MADANTHGGRVRPLWLLRLRLRLRLLLGWLLVLLRRWLEVWQLLQLTANLVLHRMLAAAILRLAALRLLLNIFTRARLLLQPAGLLLL